MPFPNFLIIGAARSGTTSLHHYLGQHPQVFMCPVKEPNYFAFDGQLGELYGPGIEHLADKSVVERDAYLNLFRDVRGERAIGEVSPRYLIARGCPERIAGEVPNAKLIAILRHPVDRAYSSFIGRRKDGWEPCRDFREAFEAEPDRIAAKQTMGLHFSAGCYADHLQAYFAHFERDQIRVVLFDDLVGDPGSLLNELFGFLQVDPDFLPDFSKRHNQSGEIPNRGTRLFWQHSERMRRSVRRIIPEGWRDWAYERITQNLERPELPASIRAEFTEYYRDDISRLSEMIDRDLGCWLDGSR